jgi:Tol biopolymer transport system component
MTPKSPNDDAVAAALVQPTATPDGQELRSLPIPPIPESQQLSFITEQDGIYGATRLTLDNAPQIGEELAVKTANNSGLSWSPSGAVLFTSTQPGNREIYVAGKDGGPPQRLTETAGDSTQPAWSPNGSRIAFSSARTGNFEIFVMDADGANLQQLTSSRGFDEWPVWSATGEKIAFVSDRDGNVDIYTMAADGSGQQRLTHHPADDWPASWSPDGSQLVFASNRDGNWNLYLIDAAGGNPVRLTNDPANERDPTWSPDGRTIAFAYDGSGNWDIYTLPAPALLSGELPQDEWRQITQTPQQERYPAWLP